MVHERDVHDLFTTGIWTVKGARSPASSHPIRANQSCKLDPLDQNDPKTPRTFSYVSHTPFPPPPSVEDEEESIAKESNGALFSLNEEEPKCKGEKDQFPIILPVPEHNPERRFVLVTPSDSWGGDSSDALNFLSTGTKYTANSKAPLESKTKTPRDEPPAPQERRARADLPRIQTDSQPHPQSRPSVQGHGSRPAAGVGQSPGTATSQKDYFRPHSETVRPAGEPLLTPFVKYATKGRDRAYWDFTAGPNETGPSDTNVKPHFADHKGPDGHARPLRPVGGASRRSQSDLEVPKLQKSERHTSYKDESRSRTKINPPTSSSHAKRSSPRHSRRDPSPARLRTDALKAPRTRPSYHDSASSPRHAAPDYSSDDARERKSHRSTRERRKSTVIHGDRSAFLGASGSRSWHASKPTKPRSPSLSPVLSQETCHRRTQTGPRSSTVFGPARPVSPTLPGTPSSARSRSRLRVDTRASDAGRHRGQSRTPSIKSNASSSTPISGLASGLSTTSLPPLANSTSDRPRQTMPPTPTWSRPSSVDTAPSWQPEPFHPPTPAALSTPRHGETNIEQSAPSVVSYRRYSGDVGAGTLPDVPDCPRKRARAGYTDWFTLPRNDNFKVCPSCYDKVFYPTSLRDLLVPAPARFRDKAVACDLGASPWYLIAWLMTRKYRRTDLRLLQGIAEVSHRNQVPCLGPVRVTRTWHSILDPDTMHCISSFKICTPCAESVQMLFPSLTGIFVPVDRQAEPKPGKCSMHFAPHRTRFLTYFDVLESTHDRAMARNTVPDTRRLVERIDWWAGIKECPHDESQRNASWYTMASIPGMTVCEDCFLSTVYPELVNDTEAIAKGTSSEGRAVSAVARNFSLTPRTIRSATLCQMASPKMRELFQRACGRPDGVAYLASKVKDRLRSL